MKTAFSTGPGFYAAASSEYDDTVPPGVLRIFCARLEAYDGPKKSGTDFDATEFKLLPAMADGNPQVARALLQLHTVLTSNLKLIEAEAKR
jgi:hypothetical protein